MNKKERLRVFRTPEKSIINDDSLYMPSPVLKQYTSSKPLPKKIERPSLWKRLTPFLSHIHFILLYGTIIYLQYSKPQDTRVEGLIKEITFLKNENTKLRTTRGLINYATVEHNTTVRVHPDDLYLWGMYGFRQATDPMSVLSDSYAPGECLSLSGIRKKFFISLGKPRKISRIGVYHPKTTNKKSAVKRFQILGYVDSEYVLLGDFEFDVTKDAYQVFDIKEVTTSTVVFCVFSNHGCKEYTSIYRVYVYGIDE